MAILLSASNVHSQEPFQILSDVMPVLDSQDGGKLASTQIALTNNKFSLDAPIFVSYGKGSTIDVNAVSAFGIRVRLKLSPENTVTVDLSDAKRPPFSEISVEDAAQLALMWHQSARVPDPGPPWTVHVIAKDDMDTTRLRTVAWSGTARLLPPAQQNAASLKMVSLALLWKDYALKFVEMPVIVADRYEANDGFVAILNGPVYLPVTDLNLPRRDSNLVTRYGIRIREVAEPSDTSKVEIDISDAEVPQDCVFSLEDAVRAVILSFRLNYGPKSLPHKDVRIIGGPSGVDWKALEGPLWSRSVDSPRHKEGTKDDKAQKGDHS